MDEIIAGVCILVFVFVGIPGCSRVYDLAVNNRDCDITYAQVKRVVPQYRIETISTGASTKIKIYDSIFRMGHTTYVGNDVRVECR